MDTILVVIGVLGFGAVVIAAYVFTVAARSYVSNGNREFTISAPSASKTFIERNEHNRRQFVQLEFPVTMNGILIPFDRRTQLDRRRTAA